MSDREDPDRYGTYRKPRQACLGCESTGWYGLCPHTEDELMERESHPAADGGSSMNGLHILQHSIGADEYGRIVRGGGRNHFVTGEGSDDYPHCMALVEAGLMTRRAGSAISGGDDIFHVTDAGRAYVAEKSPAPPKLTASQRRYADYLDADSDMSFGDWLKRQKARTPSPLPSALD